MDGSLAASHNRERIFEAELYRLKARTLLVRGGARTEADGLLDQAFGVHEANRPDRLSFELQGTFPRYGLSRAKAAKRSVFSRPSMPGSPRASTRGT